MHAGANPQKGRSRSKLSNGAEGAFHESTASASTYLSLSDAFRGTASRPGQVPKVRYGLAPGGYSFRLASTHDPESVAPCHHGCCDGPRDGGRHDAYALIVAPPVRGGGTIEPDPNKNSYGQPNGQNLDVAANSPRLERIERERYSA